MGTVAAASTSEPIVVPMRRQTKVLCIVGTRPEAIKIAPVIRALAGQPWANVRVVATAQHRGMLDQALALFNIVPDIDLNIMQHDQTLAGLTACLVESLDAVLDTEAPDIVLAQGDTTTVMVAALVAFYHRIPFGHVEAGLRTGNLQNPFPEEANRVIASVLATWHFAPTETARQNLLRAGISGATIHVTGNTVIDALWLVVARNQPIGVGLDPTKRLVLLTAHRRENFGMPLEEALSAVKTLVDRNEDIEVLYPVHPNPNVSEAANRLLAGHPRIKLCAPLEYGSFVTAMRQAYIILTDSGGVQEEAPALGKPVLVLRNETERPEAVTAGVVKLIGTNRDTLLYEAERLLRDDGAYGAMAQGISPYGDGRAAERIVAVLAKFVGSSPIFDSRDESLVNIARQRLS